MQDTRERKVLWFCGLGFVVWLIYPFSQRHYAKDCFLNKNKNIQFVYESNKYECVHSTTI